MRSGAKTEKVTIQSFTSTRDPASNEVIASWSTWREPWCIAETKRGREHFEGGQRFAETIVLLRFDYLDVDGITPTMRIVWNGATYDIRHIQPNHTLKDETVVEMVLSRSGAHA